MQTFPNASRVKQALSALRLALALALLATAAALVLRADPRDELRAADRLFLAGRYHAALQSYARVADATESTTAALRLGMLRTLRGEYDPAERALRIAFSRNAQGLERRQTLLYLGHALASRGRDDAAARMWNQLDTCVQPAACALRGARQILAAERALLRADYAAAETAYRAALTDPLDPAWHELARYRLALLAAARGEATNNIDSAAPQGPAEPFLAPLLPRPTHNAAALRAVLAAAPTARPQLLGQLLLDEALYPLAEAQFSAVQGDSPEALAAAAYAAYSRWRAGDYAGGKAQLEQLVAAHPDEARARTMLALAYLAQNDSDAARNQLEHLGQLTPNSPNLQLAWAGWHAAQRDYLAASESYGQAIQQAVPSERGRYALLAANFHIVTLYNLCDEGLLRAELAANSLPADPAAWTTLAASRLDCRAYSAAAAAARTAQHLADSADAAYYLGAALAALGEKDAARAALVRAADLAPASVWRERAEEVLKGL